MTDLILDDIDVMLRGSPDPAMIFGTNPEATLKRFRIATHPDRYPDQADRAMALWSRLEALYATLVKPVVIGSPKRSYRVTSLLATGDVSDVYQATADDKPYLLKCSRVKEGSSMLEREAKVLTEILSKAGTTSFSHNFETLCESFPVKDSFRKCVNVFTYEPGFFTLEQVHAKYPKLEPRHLAWIFKRVLSALGLVHRCGFVHGAILPCHVLVHAENHGSKIVGWGQSTKTGEIVRSGVERFRDFYPEEVIRKKPALSSTDIYMAAKCIEWLAGGEPLPNQMSIFLKACLLPGSKMRLQDAWNTNDLFDEMLRGLFGPPRYVALSMA